MENRSTHLSTWVNADLKERFAAAAARQGLSESALLKRLVEQMLAGAGEELTAERPTAVARDARVTVRLVPDDNLLLRERAVARGLPADSAGIDPEQNLKLFQSGHREQPVRTFAVAPSIRLSPAAPGYNGDV